MTAIMNEMNSFQDRLFKLMQEAGYNPDEVISADPEKIIEAERAEDLRRIHRFVLKAFGHEFSGVERISDLSLPESAAEAVKRFYTDPDMVFLLMRGGTGTAKTAVAKIFFQHHLIAKYKKTGSFSAAVAGSKYVRALEFFDILKTQNADPGGAGEFIRHHANYSFFVMDEIAASYGTEFERIYFNQLIDDFYAGKSGRGRKMILISNAPDHASLERYLGKPALSRIDHRGLIVNMVHSDWRRQFKNESFA